jgi:hypothetical protein
MAHGPPWPTLGSASDAPCRPAQQLLYMKADSDSGWYVTPLLRFFTSSSAAGRREVKGADDAGGTARKVALGGQTYANPPKSAVHSGDRVPCEHAFTWSRGFKARARKEGHARRPDPTQPRPRGWGGGARF